MPLTAQERVELVDVAEVLYGTFGEINEHGVLVERGSSLIGGMVTYSDPENPSEPIREMSPTAYVAEFYKLSGNSIDDSDTDEFLDSCSYVGGVVLGSVFLDRPDFSMFDALRKLAEGDNQ